MIRCLLVSMLLLAFVAAGVPAQAADREPPSVSVTGTATTKVRPDYAEWAISLDALDMDPAQAKRRVDAWVERLFEVRDDLDIAQEDFETGPASVEKVYRYDQGNREQVFQGYRIVRHVVVRQRDLDAFDAFLGAFAQEGHTFTMQLRSSDEEQVRRDTRIEAVKAAKLKAEEVADAAGVGIGMPLRLDASEDMPPRPMAANMMMMRAEAGGAGGSEAPFTPGAIEVRVTVQATFELIR